MNTNELERPVYQSTLKFEVAETKQMLTQQQLALSSLTETLKSIQTEIGKRNDATLDVVQLADVNKEKMKVKSTERQSSTFFVEDTDQEAGESDKESGDNEDIDEPPTKQSTDLVAKID